MKEKFKVKCSCDHQGSTEEIIPEESEIINAVEKWLEKNIFSDLLKSNGIVRYNDTFGIKVCVKIDTRDKKIFVEEEIPGQGRFDESFLITLVAQQQIELEDGELLGDANTLNLLHSEITEILGIGEDWEQYHNFEKNDDGTFIVPYSQVSSEISVEDWINNYSDEFYSDAEDTVIDYYLENVGDDWQEKVIEYYDQLREYRRKTL